MLIASKLFHHYLEPGEEIYDVFHRHPAVMLPDMMRIGFFGYLIPAFLYYLFPDVGVLFFIWMFISTIRVLYVVMHWYHDAILLTSVSLLCVAWEGFFDRTSSRLEYPMVEGVSYEFRGLRQNIFNYGMVSIARAGSTNPLVLKEAMNPRKVERRVMAQQEKFVSHQSLKDADALKSLLTTLIRHHAKNE